MPSLTVYRIRDELVGAAPGVLDLVLEPGALASCTVHDYADDTMTARLYVPSVERQPPLWTPFLRRGFPGAAVDEGLAPQALIVAAVRWNRRDRLFAIPFGHARFLIRHELIEPAFGRRVALNLLYEDGGGPADRNRIRQVDSRTFEANVRRARVQRSRDTEFETFGVDPQRDLLDRVVGVPRDRRTFGSRVTGGDPLQLVIDIGFGELGALLRRLLTTHGRTTYQRRFAWTDRIQPVVDPLVLSRLRDHAVRLALAEDERVELAPPGIVDWGRVDSFTYEIGDRPAYSELRLADYLAAVRGSRIRGLDYRKLLAQHVTVGDGNGDVVARWSVARTLTGEFELDGAHYVLDDGHFYVVAASFLAALNDFVGALAAPVTVLPPSTAGTVEEAYNRAVAGSLPGMLLLDRKTVQPAARTTPVEICDLMTDRGELVHVKRKLGSSQLSHLFSQGFVSAEIIHAGPDLRTVVRAKIDEQALAQGLPTAVFGAYLDEPFNPSRLTVVYAVVADWRGRRPHEGLPFFSKITLRHNAQQIARMGFGVAFTPVEAP